MLNNPRARICVLGCWHQGAVAAGCLAELGHDVVGADPDAGLVDKLNEGRAALHEPGLNELLRKGLDGGKLRFTTDMAEAVAGREFVLLMFDTPVDENDESNLAPIFDAGAAIAPALAEGATVLVTAQVPVGTCENLARTIREANPSANFGIAYSPENLRLGQAIDRFMNPPLPVVGADDEKTLNHILTLLDGLCDRWERVSLRTAEMVKHGLNAFLATSISFGNELGNLCDELGADGKRLSEVLRLEPRIGSKAMILPGSGFSGGTIARDVQTLRRLGNEHALPTRLLDGVWESNQLQLSIAVRMLKRALGELRGRRIAVWGLTYKPGTSTLRRSASLDIIRRLVEGGATVAAHDPRADREELRQHTGFEFCEDVYDTVRDADAVALVTGWPEYGALDFAEVCAMMRSPIMVDVNNMLDVEQLKRAGFKYHGVGRGSPS